MRKLGEDIVLVALREDGKVSSSATLRFGVAGGELVELVVAGRVGVERGRLTVLDSTPTGDALLDAALASIAGARRAPQPKTWVAQSRAGHLQGYLRRMAELGIVREERVRVLGIFGSRRWPIQDPASISQARARLDAVALSEGPVSLTEAAFGGLVHAVGLDRALYRGSAGRPARARLQKIAKRDPASRAVGEAVDALQESVDAAVDSAVSAAVSASVHAAHHAASAHHGGGGGGGGHH